ncbi:MAG: hypothetical protein ACYTDX_00095 [Planctomycetota bacterium]
MKTKRVIGLVAGLVLAMFAAGTALAGSETPPKGPPWVRDFHEAQTTALKQGKPIFVYLTKTH